MQHCPSGTEQLLDTENNTEWHSDRNYKQWIYFISESALAIVSFLSPPWPSSYFWVHLGHRFISESPPPPLAIDLFLSPPWPSTHFRVRLGHRFIFESPLPIVLFLSPPCPSSYFWVSLSHRWLPALTPPIAHLDPYHDLTQPLVLGLPWPSTLVSLGPDDSPPWPTIFAHLGIHSEIPSRNNAVQSVCSWHRDCVAESVDQNSTHRVHHTS